MSSLLTTTGKLALAKGATAWDTATYKAMLVGPGYTPSVAHATIADASAYEVSGTGYTGGYGGSGRKTLGSKTVTADAQGRIVCDAADLIWTVIDAGLVGFVCVVRETGGTDVSSVLLAVLAYPVTNPAGSDLPVVWPTTGLFYLS